MCGDGQRVASRLVSSRLRAPDCGTRRSSTRPGNLPSGPDGSVASWVGSGVFLASDYIVAARVCPRADGAIT
jgi:hypothetical protein